MPFLGIHIMKKARWFKLATNFPNQTFPTMQDITDADAALVASYQDYMEAGNLTAAQAALANITNHKNKIITADLINSILDTCVAIQDYYNVRYSPAYVVSETQPTNQQPTDFWFEVTA